MKDIETRADIEHLINTFYKKVIVDEVIGHFFTEVVTLDWEVHIPVMYDFWESMLFDKTSYTGNPMQKHIALDRKTKLQATHFDRWLVLWEGTVNEFFKGEHAKMAIAKAGQLVELMRFKIRQVSQ